eukprot:SAG22_NODE_21799_length_254_cov_0.638710_1_plen_37_part_10
MHQQLLHGGGQAEAAPAVPALIDEMELYRWETTGHVV